MTALAVQNSNAAATTSLGEMSVQAIVDRKRKILEVMDAVMKEGEHYGKIPGCGDKPTLLKPGAEVLATVFGLAPEFDIAERDLGNGHREYRIVCTLRHIASGCSLGQGVGICSTMESKYRWRAGGRKCPDCGVAAIKKSKFENTAWYCHAKTGGCGAQWRHGDPQSKEFDEADVERTENPDIADVYNTVLKMAKKRAQVDVTLTAVGASDILTQDIEDLPPAHRDAIDVEFTDRPSPPKPVTAIDGHPLLADIDNATCESDLEALVPRLRDLTGKLKDEARKRYGARKAWLKQHVVEYSKQTDEYAFDPEAVEAQP